jgi:hypothetical protein
MTIRTGEPRLEREKVVMGLSILPHGLLCVGLLLAAVGGSRAHDEKSNEVLDAKIVVAQFAKVREILASVDELPPKKARWVKVRGGSGKNESWWQGWLVLENADGVELLEGDGSVSILSKKKLAAKAPTAEFGWYDVRVVADADFVAYCREALTKKKEPTKDDDSFGAYRMAREIHDAQQRILLFARLACWARETGNSDLTNELAVRSMRLHQEHLETYPYRGTQTEFHRFVAHNTFPRDKLDGTAIYNASSGDERDHRQKRVEQLAYLRRLAKIPYRPKHDETVAAIGHYESLIAEDKTWKEPTKEEFAKLNVQQMVDYWIYHLRNLDVRQSSQPGMCYVLTEDFGLLMGQHLSATKKPNAAVELKQLSYDAIPKIIAHLEDGRPTKCIGYWRDFAPESYHTLTYGDCCQQIFEAIALTTIYEGSTTSGYPHRDGVAKQCKERAEAWWKDFQKKGEKQVLIEGVSLGKHNSDWQAGRLIEKYPEAAFVPVTAGIRAAKEDWIRSNMLNSLRGLKDDRLVPFLREEAKGPFLKTRVNACKRLLERGQEEAVGLLVSEWKSAKLDDDRGNWDLSDLRSALVRCGRVDALDALFGRWRGMSVDAKLEVLRGMGEWNKDYAGKPATKELAMAIETRLASCLDERDEDQHLSRICEVAAYGLSHRWNLPKLFDAKAGPAARNRAVLDVKNVWLKSHGKEQVAVAVPVKSVVDTKEVDPLLAAIVAAPNSDDARKAIARIERLGLPSLEHLRTRIKSIDENEASRKSLEAVASRIACTVASTRLSDNSVASPAEILAIAKSLKGKPISAEDFVEMLLAITKFVPANASGLSVAIDRDGDDTGMQLEIRLLARNDPKPGQSVHLRRVEIIRLGGDHFHSGLSATAGISSDDSVPYDWSRKDLNHFARQLKAALESPSDKQLQVRISLARGR